MKVSGIILKLLIGTVKKMALGLATKFVQVIYSSDVILEINTFVLERTTEGLITCNIQVMLLGTFSSCYV